MKIFELRSDLVAAHLRAGQLVKIKGGTVVGDDDHAEYIIKTSGEYGGTPDEINDLTIANGNIAVLQVPGRGYVPFTDGKIVLGTIRIEGENVNEYLGFGEDVSSISGITNTNAVRLSSANSTVIDLDTPNNTSDSNVAFVITHHNLAETLMFLNNAGFTYKGNTVWHAGNDGVGSGLDADLLGNVASNFYARQDIGNNFSGINVHETHVVLENNIKIRTTENDDLTARDTLFMDASNVVQVGATNNDTNIRYSTSFTANGNTVWHSGNDGAGSGLDADTIDGVQMSDLARLDQNENITSAWTFTNDNIDLNNVKARTILFDNLEYTGFAATTDGEVGVDASQGLMIYRTQQIGDASGNGVYTILDKSNVSGGNGINLTGISPNEGGSVPLTIELDGTYTGTFDVTGNINVGTSGGGNSVIQFHDDNSNTERGLRWNDSNNTFEVEDNNGSFNEIAHAGNYGDIIGSGTSLADVGSYALLEFIASHSGGTGNTFAGSGLQYVNTGGASSGTSPAGTWRRMGYTTGGAGSGTLFLRVS